MATPDLSRACIINGEPESCPTFDVDVGEIHRVDGNNRTAEGIVEVVVGGVGTAIGVGSTLLCTAATAEEPLAIIDTGHCILVGGSAAIASASVLADGLINVLGNFFNSLAVTSIEPTAVGVIAPSAISAEP